EPHPEERPSFVRGPSPMKKPQRPKRPKRPRPKRRNPKTHSSRRPARRQREGSLGHRGASGVAASSSTNACRGDRDAASKQPRSTQPRRAQVSPEHPAQAERPAAPPEPPSSLLAAIWLSLRSLLGRADPPPQTAWSFSATGVMSALLCVWALAFLTFGPSLATVGCSEPKQGPPPIEEGTIRGLSDADTLFFYDQRGTLLAETSGTGEVRARFNAYPYGATRHQSSSESRLYAGAPRDAGVGLDHMGARFYAPDLGAWTIPDPVLVTSPELVATGQFATANPYAYANLNPVIAVDDDGNFWHIAVGAGAGAFFGGGFEAARQYSAQGGFKGWDWGRIAAAASGGAVSGTILAVAPQTSLSSFLLANAGASAAGGITQRLILSGGADAGTLRDIAIDAGVGAVTAGALRGGAAALRSARPPAPPPASRTRVLDSEGAFKRQYAEVRKLTAGQADEAVSASTPVGRRGAPLAVPPGTNSPATIGGRYFTGHALDQMQS